MPRPPPTPTLFPYTTLFRSHKDWWKVLFNPGQYALSVAAAWVVMYLSVVRPSLSHRSEEHTSELQSHVNLVCRLLLEKKNMHGGADVQTQLVLNGSCNAVHF